MKPKLILTSIATLGLLSGFVLAIFLSIAYFVGSFHWMWLIGLTVLFNFIVWLIGPYISDLMYKWFYKITFYEYEDIKDRKIAQFIKKLCDENHIKTPKIGIIPDDNPTAFTYGSAAFNARIVMTEGLFKFLNEDELEAVAAHEVGHIVHKDFIIMTIAATLLQILYEMYVILTKQRHASKAVAGDKKGERGGGILVIIGYVSYLFYFIGTYVMLFLSRTREYYADEFAAQAKKDPNILARALVKVAYGIASVPDTDKTAHLLNNTRAQGIFDFKAAGEFGLMYINAKEQKKSIGSMLLFDLVNPWAWWYELNSTHPLIGKRVRRLNTMTKKPEIDLTIPSNIDKGKLWGNFFKDAIVLYSVPLAVVAAIAFTIYAGFTVKTFPYFVALGGLAFIAIIAILRAQYMFTLRTFTPTDIAECLSDVYASPVRGKQVLFTGKPIGRGEAGYIFGEDMIFQDKTGIIYLNYESGIPLFGNFFVGWKKVEKFVGKEATASGWFVRGSMHMLQLDELKNKDDRLKSRLRAWKLLFTPILCAIIGIIIILFYLRFSLGVL